MSKKSKLIDRFVSNPKDFTFSELITLLALFGYQMDSGGMTSGSRVRFVREDGDVIYMHRNHAYKCLLPSVINKIKRHLKEKNLI